MIFKKIRGRVICQENKNHCVLQHIPLPHQLKKMGGQFRVKTRKPKKNLP